MNFTSTKGPWVRTELSRGTNPAIARVREKLSSPDRGVAFIEYGPPSDTAEANARLIAAAPQLLERLKEAVEILRDSTDIAMATGLAGLDQWLIDVRADLAEIEGAQ